MSGRIRERRGSRAKIAPDVLSTVAAVEATASVVDPRPMMRTVEAVGGPPQVAPSRASETARDPWTWIAFLVPAAAVALSLMQTEDLAYQVRAGSLMWQTHAVLRSDPFTFTVGGQPWQDQQWGAQIVLAALHGLGGWRALIIVRALIVGGATGVTYLRTAWRGAGPRAAVVTALVAFIVCATLPGSIAMRPQLLAVPLFLVTGLILGVRTRRPLWLWVVPLIGIVWVNVHGSFVLLPLLCGIALSADLVEHAPARRTFAVFVVALVVPLVNPWGYRSYTYVFDLATNPTIRTVIDEWRPMWRQVPAGILFAASSIGVAFLLARGGWAKLRVEDRLIIVIFTVAAIVGGRNVVWWSLATPPAIGAALPTGRSVWPRMASIVARGSVAAIAGIAFLGLAREPSQQALSDAPAGITAAAAGAAVPGSHMFAGWWGSWLEYADPESLQFVDARAEIFPGDVWDEYFRISRAAPGWKQVLDRRGVDVVVASRTHQGPLISAMGDDPAWRTAYADAEGVVFVRAASPGAIQP